MKIVLDLKLVIWGMEDISNCTNHKVRFCKSVGYSKNIYSKNIWIGFFRQEMNTLDSHASIWQVSVYNPKRNNIFCFPKT